MTAVSSVLGFVAVPVVTAVGGSVIAARHAAGPRLRSVVQHVAAGLVFAAASLELLPDLVREHSQVGTVIGFVAGVAVMLLLGRMSAHYESIGGQGAAIGVVALIAVDVLLDGVLMGVAFSEQARQGQILTIALTFELAFLGLSVATAMQIAGASKRKVVAVTAAIAATLPAGALLGIGPLAALPVTPFGRSSRSGPSRCCISSPKNSSPTRTRSKTHHSRPRRSFPGSSGSCSSHSPQEDQPDARTCHRHCYRS